MRAALTAINAAVVGLLLAALYRPIFTETVRGWTDVLWVLLVYLALTRFNMPPWLLVLAGGLGGWLLG